MAAQVPNMLAARSSKAMRVRVVPWQIWRVEKSLGCMMYVYIYTRIYIIYIYYI